MSDFTIGDAWGVKEKNPEFWDLKGVSLITINSAKAFEIFKEFKGIAIKEVQLSDYMQTNMSQPSSPHRNIDEFWRDYYHRPFWFMIQKYGKNNPLFNLKYIFGLILKKVGGITCRE